MSRVTLGNGHRRTRAGEADRRLHKNAPGHAARFELVRTPDGRAHVAGLAHRYVHHSPDGFEWGYGGSGPAELALNLLARFVPLSEAWRLHQAFKWDVIARVPRAGGSLSAERVRAWIHATWRCEDAQAVIRREGAGQ